MKAVILAGGKGSRISEESRFKPKPLVEIGGRPILWHIMKLYSFYGVNEFIICCGYKGHLIKEYFVNYNSTSRVSSYDLGNVQYGGLHNSNVSHGNSEKESSAQASAFGKGMIKTACEEPFKVTLVDTGLETLTAGRLQKVKQYLEGEEEFFLTYGDGVSDVNLEELLKFHREQGKCVTITTYPKEERFGRLKLKENQTEVESFNEKNKAEASLINAGFMVMNKAVFEYLGDGSEMLEDGPFEKLSTAGEMAAYMHKGFWSPMDTLKEQMYLDNLCRTDSAPWMVWK